MIKILMVGPSLKTKGGMSSVVKGYFSSEDLRKNVKIKYVESINDRSKCSKIVKMIVGYVSFLINLQWSDIVHVNTASRNSAFRKCIYINTAKLFNKSVIVHIHGGAFETFYSQECSLSEKKKIRDSFNKCDAVIVLSKKSYDFISTIVDSEKISIINNGVKIPMYVKNNYNSNLCFLGRLERDKGIYDVLDALELVVNDSPDIMLYVAGTGDMDLINKKVVSKKLSNHVVFMGWIDEIERDLLLKKSSIFLLPSYYEAMPMSIIESMSYGCAVISTNVGGIPDIIENDINGLLNEPSDVRGIAESISILLNDEEKMKEISKKAKETVVSSFNLEIELQKMVELYRSVVSLSD